MSRWFFGAFIVSLILVAAVNMLVDPFEIYGSGIMEPWQFNRYKKKLELASNLERPPEAMIIGNSRMESFDPDTIKELTGYECFNWALPAAATEIMLAVLNMAVVEKEFPLEILIIGIDPMAFHPSGFIHPQAKFCPEFVRQFEIDPMVWKLKERVKRLVSIEQVDSTLQALERDAGISATTPRLIYRDDGMAIYPMREESLTNGTYNLSEILDERVPQYPDVVFAVDRYRELAESRKSDWQEIIQLCDENGITLYVFMEPMHPELWELMKERGAEKIFDETVEYVRGTVESSGGIFRNYTDPYSFGGSPEYFWDEVHMRPENSEILMQELFSDAD